MIELNDIFKNQMPETPSEPIAPKNAPDSPPSADAEQVDQKAETLRAAEFHLNRALKFTKLYISENFEDIPDRTKKENAISRFVNDTVQKWNETFPQEHKIALAESGKYTNDPEAFAKNSIYRSTMDFDFSFALNARGNFMPHTWENGN